MTMPLPPDPKHDDALPGEAELKTLYGRLPPAGPSAALDAAIRQAAARAVQDAAAAPAARRRPRWPVALGTAATLMLATGLIWRLRELPSPPASAPAPAAVAADAGSAGGNLGERVEAPAGNTPATAMKAKTLGVAAASGEIRAPAAQKPAGRTASTLRAVPSRSAMDALELGAGQAKPPHPPAPAAQERARSTMAGAAPPALTPMAAPTAPPPAAAAAPPVEAAPVQVAPPAPMAAPVPTGPAVELDAIRTLYAQGHAAEALRRLRTFHRDHPAWPLPDDLQRRLDDAP